MAIPRRTCCLALALAGMLGLPAAWADVYVWVDALGHTNVSNLAPPDDAKVKNVIKSVPRTAAQEEAARAATQRAEMQALNDRVALLQDQLEQSRREAAVMPASFAPPPVVYAAPPPQYNWAQPQAPYVADTAPDWSSGWGCDYSPWSNCGFGFGGWPGVAVIVNNNGKHFHRGPGHGVRPTPGPKPIGPVRPLGASAVRPAGASMRRG